MKKAQSTKETQEIKEEAPAITPEIAKAVLQKEAEENQKKEMEKSKMVKGMIVAILNQHGYIQVGSLFGNPIRIVDFEVVKRQG